MCEICFTDIQIFFPIIRNDAPLQSALRPRRKNGVHPCPKNRPSRAQSGPATFKYATAEATEQMRTYFYYKLDVAQCRYI